MPHRLKWDLDGQRPLEFGSLISSSNELVDERVTIETSAPLLWTTGLRAAAGPMAAAPRRAAAT